MISIVQENLAAISKNNKNRFVVQEHHATHKHWDIRLEKDGVLKSWATRKLPDLVEDRQKKIAIFPTPDHEMDWLKFKGSITDGYGKGEVYIWDSGTYDLIKWDKHIIVRFNGKKLKGLYVFIPVKYDNKEQFLMFKKKKEKMIS